MALIDTIHEIVGFSEKARREGILALEYNFRDIEDDFLLFALKLVVDGVEPGLIQEILSTNIYFSHVKGAELLRRFIIRDGALCLQEGHNPRVVLTKLAMYLGDMGFELLETEKFDEKVKEFLSAISFKKTVSEETKKFDDIFKNMDDVSVQKILREIDFSALAYALSGANGDTIQKIFNNISSDSKYPLYDDLQQRIVKFDKRGMLDAQKKISLIVKRLQEYGEIV